VRTSLHDQRQSESVEGLDFPGMVRRRRDRAPLIENVAAGSGPSFSTEREVQLQVFFEAVLLRIRQNA